MGVSVTELARKLGIAEQTFYRWKQQYGGLEARQASGRLWINLKSCQHDLGCRRLDRSRNAQGGLSSMKYYKGQFVPGSISIRLVPMSDTMLSFDDTSVSG
jgi:hypothetical protein